MPDVTGNSDLGVAAPGFGAAPLAPGGFISGHGAPSGDLGRDGYFYLDLDSQYIYGPKTSGAWPDGVSLRGSDGTIGVDGADGAPGSQGPAGATGPAGADGAPGADGADLEVSTGSSLPDPDSSYRGKFFVVRGTLGAQPDQTYQCLQENDGETYTWISVVEGLTTVYVYDDFERADGAYAGPLVALGSAGLVIESGQVKSPNGSGIVVSHDWGDQAIVVADAGHADVTFTAHMPDNVGGLIIRFVNADTYIYWPPGSAPFSNNNFAEFINFDSSFVYTQGQTPKVVCTGSNIDFYVDGVLLGSATVADPFITATHFGFLFGGDSNLIDDFEISAP